jgi:hypothetical protein
LAAAAGDAAADRRGCRRNPRDVDPCENKPLALGRGHWLGNVLSPVNTNSIPMDATMRPMKPVMMPVYRD